MRLSTFSLIALGCMGLLIEQVAAYDRTLMLCLVNKERAKAGLKPLGPDSRLDNAAQRQSNGQANMGQMTHTGDDGSTPSQRIEQAGYDWKSVAENVAYGYKDEQTCMENWMNSPGHRANILDSKVSHFGSAVAYKGETPYYTQDFGGDGKDYNFPVCPSGGADNQGSAKPTPSPAPQPSYSPAPQPSYSPAPQPSYSPAPRADAAPAPQPAYSPAPAPQPAYSPAPVPSGSPGNLPLNWTCIDKNSKGQCRRWKKCCIVGRKWTCKEKWIGI